MSASGDPFTHASPFRADFLIPGVYSASLVMGDFDADDDLLFLRAYDASDAFMGGVTYDLDWTVSGGPMLGVSFPGDTIDHVLFGSTGTYDNSIFFDNFTYEEAPGVPEPASCALLALALGGAGAALRRRRTR